MKKENKKIIEEGKKRVTDNLVKFHQLKKEGNLKISELNEKISKIVKPIEEYLKLINDYEESLLNVLETRKELTECLKNLKKINKRLKSNVGWFKEDGEKLRDYDHNKMDAWIDYEEIYRNLQREHWEKMDDLKEKENKLEEFNYIDY